MSRGTSATAAPSPLLAAVVRVVRVVRLVRLVRLVRVVRVVGVVGVVAVVGGVVVGAGGCDDDPITGFKPPSMRVEPGALDLGPVPVGIKTLVDDKITVFNDGDAGLVLTSVTIENVRGATGVELGGDDERAAVFSVVAPPDSVRGHHSQLIAVTFDPPAFDDYTADLVVRGNDREHPEVRVTITGTGCNEADFASCNPNASGSYCIQPTEEVWNQSGDQYCSTFGLRCVGLDVYASEDCSVPDGAGDDGYSVLAGSPCPDPLAEGDLACCDLSVNDDSYAYFFGYGSSALWHCESACPAGYERSAVGLDCADVDECDRALDDCSDDQECVNERGAFRCLCKTGTVTQADGTCAPKPTAEAPCWSDRDDDYGPVDFARDDYLNIAGVKGGDVCHELGKECVGYAVGVDDTCSLYDNARSYEACYLDLGDAAGPYYPDYFYFDDGATFARWDCADECPAGTDDPAHTGFCINVDECTLRTDECGDNATCFDTDGGYGCCCEPGYVGDGVACVENDSTGVPLCQNGCQYGSPGFRDPAADCARLGKQWLGTRAWSSTDCSGAFYDEQIQDPFATSFVALCDDNCPAGTERSGFDCVDVDECLLEIDDCGANSVCHNNFGAWSCTCALGYSGDGHDCVLVVLDEPECSNADEAPWVTTGYDYCAGFGRTCTGLSLYADGECALDADATCGGRPASECCATTVDAVVGAGAQRSALWTCAVQ